MFPRYLAHCNRVSSVLFGIVIPLLGEERAGLCATRVFVDLSCIWASSWENVSSEVSDQVRLKLACSAIKASKRLEILVTETRDITLSRQRTAKAQIRLRRCSFLPLCIGSWTRFVIVALSVFLPFVDITFILSGTCFTSKRKKGVVRCAWCLPVCPGSVVSRFHDYHKHPKIRVPEKLP